MKWYYFNRSIWLSPIYKVSDTVWFCSEYCPANKHFGYSWGYYDEGAFPDNPIQHDENRQEIIHAVFEYDIEPYGE